MGLLDFLAPKDRTERLRKASALYAAAVAQARQPSFYTALGVPDTLDGRFELIVLHVHLVCRRLAQPEEAAAAALGQAVFDVMFRDMDRNLREIGVGDPSLPRKVKAMAEAYFGRAKAYEPAIAEGQSALAGVIARNIFNAETAPGAPALAQYALGAAMLLAATPLAEVTAGRVAFPPAPGA